MDSMSLAMKFPLIISQSMRLKLIEYKHAEKMFQMFFIFVKPFIKECNRNDF